MKKILAILLTFAGIAWPIAAHCADQLDKLLSGYEWTGRNCKTPPGKIPPKAYFRDPYENGVAWNKGRYISIRSKVDSDGDGFCEIYDIIAPETSNFTGKLYGYPVRVTKYKDEKLEIVNDSLTDWVPLVLKSTHMNARINLLINFVENDFQGSYFYGTDDPCMRERLVIAASYMLIFSPPPEMRTDPALSENWTGPLRDAVKERVLVNRLAPKYYETEKPELHDCMAPYEPLIDKLRLALERKPR